MSKKAPLYIFLLLALMAANSPDSRVAKRNFRQITTEFTDHSDPEKNYRKIEKLDKQGEPIEVLEWAADGKLNQRTVYVNTALINKKSVFSGQDSLLSMEITELDRRGRKVHYFNYDRKKNKTEDVKSEYNSWGEKQTEITRKNGRCTQIRNFQYNNLGLIISQTTTDSTGKVFTQKTFSYSK